ncbi:E3 ubiquitin protein ligase RIN2 isoform X1 [Selaginella moellendorffii]|uniref:E3 ubiquitin protein ligase RIN2 isoform X1 n=2 Tax=Selaginella moellendorffii TaxID=88036 RepID=UPI000D1CD90F|nr:E3 ubiquitin protein ligase RIN2 isoform X1 [Selaginella moellendorffii]|eukprot:XP_024518489.1 E3 ubiquitin protein ligase RIN2 isoform X1 [Selaginella moellendorffii]
MAGGYGSFVAMYTAISLGGIVWRINSVLQKVLPGISVDKKAFDPVDTAQLLQSLLQSSLTIVLLANLLVNFFVVLALCMKTIFFGTLTLLETQKVVERMINYVLFKGLFLTWVVQPEMMQIALWLAWFAVLGFLKMFQGLARDRLDRLNASPTATVYAHLRVFSVLVLVLLSDLFWIQLCLVVFKDTGISTFMLLLFEPLSIAFETLQAVLVHGVQLLDTWQRQSLDTSPAATNGLQPDRSVAGASWEWKGMIVRNFSFGMDLLSLFLALGHCLHIWWLRGLAFQVVDAILFLNLRALLSAILKRIKGFMRMRTAMSTLQGALPDATQEELLAYDDDCAICKEPMVKAKRLPCAHLFHLSCLRSWLDQGLADTYSCPTCRRPLFMGNLRTLGRSHQSFTRTSQHNAASLWRGSGSDSEWTTVAAGQSSSDNAASNSRGLGRLELMVRHFSGSGSSHARQSPGEGSASSAPRGLSRIELIMRQLSSTRNHQQSSSSSSSPPSSTTWGFWPFSSSSGASPSLQPHQVEAGSTPATSITDGLTPQMRSMVGMVREVLPHVSDDRIVQELRRTNCVTATVNNLL